MRKFVCLILSALLSLPVGASAEWYVRVVARGDGPAAQAEKIRVREAVLSACPRDPEALFDALPRILAAARRIAPDADVTVRPWAPEGRDCCPTLYVTLGKGQGRNWWGVLYEDALNLAAEDPSADGEVVFVWPVVDWVLAVLGF